MSASSRYFLTPSLKKLIRHKVKTSALDEVVTVQDFCNENTACTVMRKIQEVVGCNVSEADILEKYTLNKDHEYEAIHGALSCCLFRLNEACFQNDNILFETEETESKQQANLEHAKQILSEFLPSSIQEISCLFLPSDFIPDKITKLKSTLQNISGENIILESFENASENFSIQQKVRKAIQVVENISKTICSEGINEIYEALCSKISSDEETQIGLLTLSEPLLPSPIIHSVIPCDLYRQDTFYQTMGTFVMASLLVKEHFQSEKTHIIENIAKLTKERFLQHKAVIENITNNLKNTPIMLEMVSMKHYQSIEDCLIAVKNVEVIKRFGANTEEVFKFIENENMERFNMDSVQMPLITVARRISNPLMVNKMIVQELGMGMPIPNLIGLKVLMEVLEKIPYTVGNIDEFLLPSDLLQENIFKEKSLVTNFSRLVETVTGGQELVQMLGQEELNQSRAVSKAVEEIVLNLQLPINLNKHVLLEPNIKHEILNNVQGQACLYNLAEQLSSGLNVNQILTAESLKECSLPKAPGFLALARVLENIHVQYEDVQTLLTDVPYKPDIIQKYLAICQNISEIIKVSQE